MAVLTRTVCLFTAFLGFMGNMSKTHYRQKTTSISFCGCALMLSLLLLPQVVIAEPNEFSCTPKHWCHITLKKQVCGKYTVGRMAKRLLFVPNQGVWLDAIKHTIDLRADGESVTSQHFTATHQFQNDTSEEELRPGKQALLYKHDSKLISKNITHQKTEISVFECTAEGSEGS